MRNVTVQKLSFLAFSLLLGLISSTDARAHGEDEAGPHGGFIRMPGAFHTEVVKVSHQKFKVYLLDMEWKNPSTKDSSVLAEVELKGTKTQTNCVIKSNHFECSIPKPSSLKKGVLNIKAKRENAVGGLAVYDLPLKLSAH